MSHQTTTPVRSTEHNHTTNDSVPKPTQTPLQALGTDISLLDASTPAASQVVTEPQTLTSLISFSTSESSLLSDAHNNPSTGLVDLNPTVHTPSPITVEQDLLDMGEKDLLSL